MSSIIPNVLSFIPDRLNAASRDATIFLSSCFPHEDINELLETNYPPLDTPDTLLASALTFALAITILTLLQYQLRSTLKRLVRWNWFSQNNFIRILLLLFPSIHDEGASGRTPTPSPNTVNNRKRRKSAYKSAHKSAHKKSADAHSSDAHSSNAYSSNANAYSSNARSNARSAPFSPFSPKSILLTPSKKMSERLLNSSSYSVELWEPSHSSIDKLLVTILSLKFSLHVPPGSLRAKMDLLLTILLSYRIISPLSNSAADLLLDLFHLVNVKSTLKLQSVSRFKVITTSARWFILTLWFAYVLKSVGHGDWGEKILGGFGYTSLIVGWSLQQILSDVIASFCLAFDNNFSDGDKIVIYGEEGIVVSMGMRSTKIRLTFNGEELCVPNSKVASEVIKTYSVFRERRAELFFVIDADVRGDLLGEICERVGEVYGGLVEKGHCVKASDPLVYFSEITPLGLKYTMLFWVTDYHDNVSAFKKAVSDALLGIVLVLREMGVKLIAAPAAVST